MLQLLLNKLIRSVLFKEGNTPPDLAVPSAGSVVVSGKDFPCVQLGVANYNLISLRVSIKISNTLVFMSLALIHKSSGSFGLANDPCKITFGLFCFAF